ncbi:Flagellar assembly protein [Aromatoleum bremense]|nr:FliH/SctL family protein [Aromatoleum bremense]QTQ30868.1 Flagellar assembly protein [Aromatoleum bremense]
MSISRHQAVGAYRRWEPPAFGGEPEADAPRAADPAPPPPAPPQPEPAPRPEPDLPPDPEPPVRLPTAADIESMFEDARRDGHEAGYREGAEQAQQEAMRIAALADALDEALARLDRDVAEELVGLAMEVARRMVRNALAEQPEAVIETVRMALNQLPQAQARIHLHPDDVALVRAYLAEQSGHGHPTLIDDDAISRGGCLVQTAGSQLDATLETRWRRVLETLGRPDTGWQECGR